mgnify:CR=1 FL=1
MRIKNVHLLQKRTFVTQKEMFKTKLYVFKSLTERQQKHTYLTLLKKKHVHINNRTYKTKTYVCLKNVRLKHVRVKKYLRYINKKNVRLLLCQTKTYICIKKRTCVSKMYA